MKKRKVKKSKRRLVFFGTLSIIAIGYFLFNMGLYTYKILVLNQTEKELKENLKSLEQQETTLKTDIEKLKDPEYIAAYARENYMYSRDGEYIIKLDEEKTTQNSLDKKINTTYIYAIVASILCLIILIRQTIKKRKKKKEKKTV